MPETTQERIMSFKPITTTLLDTLRRDDDIKVQGFSGKIDFYTPLNKPQTWVLEAGINAYSNTTTNKKHSNIELGEQQYLFTYNERLAKPYVGIKGLIDNRFQLHFGTSYIAIWNRAQLQEHHQFNNTYSYLMPFVRLSCLFNNKLSLYASFEKSIVQPSFFQLNPFEWKLNAFTLRRGNSMLDPQVNYSVGVTYTYNSALSVGYYLNRMKYVIAEVAIRDKQNGYQVYQPRNAQNGHNQGLNVSYYVNTPSWLRFSIFGYLQYNRYSSSIPEIPSTQQVISYGGNFNSQFILTKDRRFIAFLKGSFTSATKSALGFSQPIYSASAGVAAYLLNRKLSVQLYALDLFQPSAHGYYVSNSQTINYALYSVSPGVYFNITYSFGKASMKGHTKEKSNSIIEKRLGEALMVSGL